MLLNEWRRRGRKGLTLPFLVGAVLRERGSPAGTKSDIWALLNEIASQDDDQRMVLFGWCADLRTPLLHMEFAETRMFQDLFEPADEFFVVEKTLATHLRVTASDKLELLNILVDHAEQPVNEGRYSFKRIAGEWTYAPFDQEDIQLIEAALHPGR